jgi:hypothetical protein
MDRRLSPLVSRVLMSEYQYYDFRAIDRPLARNEIAALRAISTRAVITTTSFTNHYEWGDLKANPSKLLEPPVPAGLGTLSGPLHALIEFLEIDKDLVEVAAQASQQPAAGLSHEDLSLWIRGLPDKNELLVAAAVESDEVWRNNLTRRFRRQNIQQTSDLPVAGGQRRAGGLMAVVRAQVEERTLRLNKQRIAEAAKQKAEDETNRARYLDQLGRREPEIWKQVAAHIQLRQPKGYDKAVSLLTDLHDFAVREGRPAGFQTALEKVRQAHAAKESFLRRLAKANL